MIFDILSTISFIGVVVFGVQLYLIKKGILQDKNDNHVADVIERATEGTIDSVWKLIKKDVDKLEEEEYEDFDEDEDANAPSDKTW